jgi:hypothetical protein
MAPKYFLSAALIVANATGTDRDSESTDHLDSGVTA